MKISSLASSAAALSIAVMAVLATVTVVHAGQNPPAAAQQSVPAQGAMHHPRNFPQPTNLQVLPKNLTGPQLIGIMRGWAGDLGVGCDTCHAEYSDHRTTPNGRPMLDFASDAKPEKRAARIMYTMLQTDKKDYIARVATMDTMAEPAAPLTCGTCHRGHLDPEPYMPERHEEHGPRPGAPAPHGN